MFAGQAYMFIIRELAFIVLLQKVYFLWKKTYQSIVRYCVHFYHYISGGCIILRYHQFRYLGDCRRSRYQVLNKGCYLCTKLSISETGFFFYSPQNDETTACVRFLELDICLFHSMYMYCISWVALSGDYHNKDF